MQLRQLELNIENIKSNVPVFADNAVALAEFVKRARETRELLDLLEAASFIAVGPPKEVPVIDN